MKKGPDRSGAAGLRQMALALDDLAMPEEDRLDPGLRVLFMVGLASVAGLMLQRPPGIRGTNTARPSPGEAP